jgi:fermentation-respiration switch protein FrsA (DUF1100 family)
VGLAALVVLLLAVVVVFGQRSLVFFPDRSDPGPAASVLPTGRDVLLTTDDGLTLRAWLVEPPARSRQVAVLYAPGNGGNRLGRAEVADAIAGLGFTVLLLEYRGYGGNPGKPSEDGLASDARAGAAFLRAQGYPGNRTIYVGESLGTGVVARLATTDAPAGLVLRSPFPSLVAVARAAYPWLPAGLLRDRFDTTSALSRVEAPITVLSGDADEIVPPEQSAVVAAQVRTLHRQVTLPGVGHNDDVWFGPFLAEQVRDLADAVGSG